MAYRDLKPKNALVGVDGYCKLIDFGFAKVIKGKSFTFCGTPEYMPPKLVLSAGHNRLVDYFAWGVMVYEMICGQTPFFDYTTDGILRNIVKGKFRFDPKFSEPLKDLIMIRNLSDFSVWPQHLVLFRCCVALAPEVVPHHLSSLLPFMTVHQQLLLPNPVKRLGMQKGGVQDILQHEWFSDIDIDLLAQQKLDPPWKSKPHEVENVAEDESRPSIARLDEDYISKADWLNFFG